MVWKQQISRGIWYFSLLLIMASGCSRSELPPGGPGEVVYTAEDPESGDTLMSSMVLLDDRPYIFVYDGSAGKLQAVYAEEGSWTTELIVGGGDSDLGLNPAVAAKPDGSVVVVFRDDAARNIQIAEGLPGSWSIETPLPAGEDRGSELDVAVDLGGNPWIAFHNRTTQALEVVHRSEGNWILDRVDDDGDTGHWPSIAADLGGRMSVAYHSASEGSLKLAQLNLSSGWDLVTVDAPEGRSVGTWTGLAVRAGENQDLSLVYPRILYLDESEVTLRYAQPVSAASNEWEYATVDAGLFGGTDNCIAVSDKGTVYAAYLDATTLDLKIGRYQHGKWRTWSGDAVGATGFFAGCDTDRSGRFHVVYSRRDTGKVLYKVVRDRY